MKIAPSAQLTPHFFSPLHSKSFITVLCYINSQCLHYYDYVNDVYY